MITLPTSQQRKTIIALDEAFYRDWLEQNRDDINNCMHILENKAPQIINERMTYYSQDSWQFILRRILIEKITKNPNFHKQLGGMTLPYIIPKIATEIAYQCIDISMFPKKLISAYKQVTGENLTYQKEKPVHNFYNFYAKLDSWSLEEAACIVCACDPNARCKQFLKSSISYNLTNEKINCNPLFAYSKDAVESCLAITYRSKEILAKTNFVNDTGYVKPIDFLDFCDIKEIAYNPLLRELVLENLKKITIPVASNVSTDKITNKRSGRPSKFNKDAWGVEIFRYFISENKLPENKTVMVNHIRCFEEKQTGQTPSNTVINDFLKPYYDILKLTENTAK